MSTSLRSSASAVGLLTEEDCFKLLDTDFLYDSDDVLKNFPSAAPKAEVGYQAHDDITASMYPPSPPEYKPHREELANDFLEQFDPQCKQEVFPNWLEEKVELPIFDQFGHNALSVDVGAPAAVPVLGTVAGGGAYSVPQHTEELLREFENVYDAVELTHLTPPQSPPGPATKLLLSYAQAHVPIPVSVPASVPVHVPVPASSPLSVPVAISVPASSLEDACTWGAPSPTYYDSELASVEELVRYRASQLVSPQPSPQPSPSEGSNISSPRSSPPSSPRSTDEEWSGPMRLKSYSRSTADRRSRKKEQNKNAATRYRQKKKAEIEVLLSEERQLRQKHTELGDRCSDVQREIRYLKALMRDLFKAKGLIK